MPDPVTGLIVGGSSIIGGAIQGNAAKKAGAAQAAAAQQGIDVQYQQFREMQETLSPYVQAGYAGMIGLKPFAEAGLPAFQQQQALVGLAGPEAQKQAIAAIAASPEMAAMTQQGEEAILARASATGGLRGGNTQAALAQFRPQVLSQLINQQYGRLGGIAGTGLGVLGDIVQRGQASAAGQAAQGMGMASNIGELLAQQGAARAGGIVGGAAPFANMFNMPAQFVGFGMGQGGTGSLRGLFGG